MLKLIKEAQSVDTTLALIVENCTKYNVSKTLLESLDGVLHKYVQGINSGELQNLDYGDLHALANVFAFASMLGVLEVPEIDPNGANAILNLYKTARPGNPDATASQIDRAVARMAPDLQSRFKQLANAWGKSLSATVQRPTPEAMKAIANRLLKAIHTMAPVIQKLETTHSDAIMKQKVRGGILSRQLGVSPV